LSFGSDVSFDEFKQNFINSEQDTLRNATRVNFRPYFSLNLFDDGVFSLNTKYLLDFQYYDFKRDNEADYRKYSGLMQTAFSFEVSKVFGLSYIDTKIDSDQQEVREKILGELETFSIKGAQKVKSTAFKSYKHSQKFNFIHHYIPGEDDSGNPKFANQINNSSGWFDFYDSIRSLEFSRGDRQTRTQISPVNTFEFQWRNNVIEKSPKPQNYELDGSFVNDNFDYSRVFYFDLSQGVELVEQLEDESETRLTRLGLNAGFLFSEKFRLVFDEYYFHEDKLSIFNVGVQNDFDRIKIFNNISYNDFSRTKVHSFGFDFAFTDEFIFLLSQSRDLTNAGVTAEQYRLSYSPANDCWIAIFSYEKLNNIDRVTFDFALNFGNQSFYNKVNRIF
jgi:hypothetical protein